MSSRVVIALALLAACSKSNPNYCPGHPDNNCALDAAPGGDAAQACDTAADCPGQVCDTQRHACVTCTPAMAAACTGTTPVCGGDDACHPCTADAECGSMACLPDGSCADAGAVLYASPTGSTTATCTSTDPCSIDHAVSLVDATHDTIRAAPGMYSLGTTLALSAGVTIVGRGATLAKTSGPHGAAVTVTGPGTFALDYVTIEGGDDVTLGHGIACANATLSLLGATVQMNLADGISANGCTLDLARTAVQSNTGGGVAMSTTSFDIENSFVVKNGSATSGFGGVLISQLGSGAHTLAFDTIAHNAASTGLVSGITCSAIAMPITFSNDIVYGNSTSQVTGGNCAYTYSDVGPDMVTGTGNTASDPMFAGADDFHVRSASAAIDAADPAATLAVDVDGDPRPQGAARDIGADEYKP